ncbi:hypothetical protein EDD11_003294 [Mortierella claussenii]|nr:hypothetical protein EDD11_003294 [Mortierella claussenii]
MSMTTSAHFDANRLLEELSDQIIAVTQALDIARQTYVNQLHESANTSSPTPATKSSWNSSSSIIKTHVADKTIPALPANQHPIVLSIWATSSTEQDYRNSLGRVLMELIQEKRRYSREVELIKLKGEYKVQDGDVSLDHGVINRHR